MLCLLCALAWVTTATLSRAADDPVVVPPVLLEAPTVPYPAGIDAGARTVPLLITIDVEGRVVEARATDVQGAFAQAAVRGARASRFEPARVGEVPTAVEVTWAWEFPRPPVNLTGQVRRAGTGVGVDGVIVTAGSRAAGTTDGGRFDFRNLAPGPVQVRVAENRWRSEPVTVTVGDDVTEVELWVDDGFGGNEVVGRYRRTSRPEVRRTVSADEARALPGALGDLVRALQTQPAVSRTPFDSGWVLIRAGNPEDTGMFLDGVEVPLVFHLGGFTSVIHPELVAAVHLYAGAYPARLRGGLTGAVELETRPLEGPPRGVGGINLVFAHAFAQVSLGSRGALALAARRSYLDGVLTLALGRERAAIAPRFWDAQARVQLPRYALTLIGSSDAIDVPTGDGADLVRVTQHAAQVQGRGSAPIGPLQLVAAHWVALQQRRYSTTVQSDVLTDLLPGARVEVARDTPGVRWQLGLEGEARWFQFARGVASRSGPLFRVDPYAEIELTATGSARFGVRHTTLVVPGQLARSGWSPRMALSWPLAGGLVANVEAIEARTLPRAMWVVALPDGPYLPLQRGRTVSAGLTWNRDVAQVSVAVFTRAVRDLAAFEADGSLGTSDTRAVGLELAGELSVGTTHVAATAQIARSRMRDDPGDPTVPTRFDRPVQLDATFSHRAGRTLLAARFRYTSGFLLDDRADEAWDVLRQQSIPLTTTGGDRLPAWHSLDLKIARRITWKSWRLEAYLDVQNAYNRRVPEPTISGLDDTIPVYGFGLPVLPVFGVDGSFWPRTRTRPVSDGDAVRP